MLDDAHPDGAKSKKRQASSLYDFLAPNDKKKLNPVGEWNSSRVVAKGKHLKHYLNGELVVEIVVVATAGKRLTSNQSLRARIISHTIKVVGSFCKTTTIRFGIASSR